MDNNPDVVVNVLKPLFGDLKGYLWPLLYSLLSVGSFPWIAVFIQRLRRKPLMVSKTEKLDFELKLLKAKEKIIAQEAHNEGLKTKISKEMELSLKEQEFDLDQKIGRSDLNAKIEEVEKEKRKNLREREDLDKDNQTVMEKRKKLEQDENKNAQEKTELDKVNQSLKDEGQKLKEDKLEHVKEMKDLLKKQKKPEEHGSSASALTTALAAAGGWDGNKKEIDSKNKTGAVAKALKTKKSRDIVE